MKAKFDKEQLKNAILGAAIGDALGVPVEFKSREYLEIFPVSDMYGYMSWNQPPGTWSDDSSMMLCLLEGLSEEYDIELIGNKFVKWYTTGYWGAHHKVFDIGGSTRHALNRIIKGESAKNSGNIFEEDNGNGSLMRTLPLAFYLKEKSVDEVFQTVKEVSQITHAHFRSIFSCFIYTVLAIEILKTGDRILAYKNMQKNVNKYSKLKGFNNEEVNLFKNILEKKIWDLSISEIRGSGYVLQSLEASLWSFYSAQNYKEAILLAVNLGEDTDTTGTITGGISGLFFGLKSVPKKWLEVLARKNDIEELCDKFYESQNNN